MSSHITDQLTRLLKANTAAPFLFIGSGFSRRYIGLENWEELLSKFCENIKSFGFYSSQNNKDMPKTASDMAKDFNPVWWENDEYAESRGLNEGGMDSVSSALKYEISKYLREISSNKPSDEKLLQELEVLSRINVDGIITTNWDLFLEELFPDYQVFVGQEELLFSNPQSIAEIYKIHGCSSRSNSLVLTSEDYQEFEGKNPYLAAKLITLFIEHPIIFIGYSISDKNIQKIIESIVNCLGQDKLDKFGRNLVFVQRPRNGEAPSFNDAIMSIGDTRLSITVIKTTDFLEIYEAIESTKRKIPARILRYCKEQMYDLVRDNDPEGKLAVIDLDQIENKDDVEFVMGVGVAKDAVSSLGYIAITVNDILLDIIGGGSKFNSHTLLKDFYPTLIKRSNKYIPIYKYLRAVGINSLSDLKASEYSNLEEVLRKATRDNYRIKQYQKQFSTLYAGLSTAEIIANLTSEKAAIMIPQQNDSDIDIAAVKAFLQANTTGLASGNYATYYRRLGCLIDLIEDGFPL